MKLGESTDFLRASTSDGEEEVTSLGSGSATGDRNPETGLTSPPPKRVKLSESPEYAPASPAFKNFDESSGDLSDECSASPDSSILDFFHAEGLPGYHGKRQRLSHWLIEGDIKITKEECEALKTELRSIGGANFMRKHIYDEPRYTINEILFALGYVLVRLLSSDGLI